MRFGNPEYFRLLLGAPVLIGFFMWAAQKRRAALHAFISPRLAPRLTASLGMGRRVFRHTLYIIFFLFFVLTLVRFRFGVKMEMIERKGVDIIVAMDISRSMLAEDIAPDRLTRAKHETGKFIDLLKGDRIGLVVFAGEAFVQCPLTLDYGAAKMFLDAVEADWIRLQGTNLAGAIGLADEAFHSKARKHKVLVLLSDGEDHEGEAVEAAREAAEKGVKIYTVGVGSEQGVPIPIRKSGGNVVYKKDNSGNLVMTRLNQVVLEKISLEGNGKYFHAGTSLDLEAIYREIMKMEKKDLGLNKMRVFEERYQLFLLVALVLLLAEFFVPERIHRAEVWRGRFSS